MGPEPCPQVAFGGMLLTMTDPKLPDEPSEGIMDDIAFVGSSLLLVPHEESCRTRRGGSPCDCPRAMVMDAWKRLVARLGD